MHNMCVETLFLHKFLHRIVALYEMKTRDKAVKDIARAPYEPVYSMCMHVTLMRMKSTQSPY